GGSRLVPDGQGKAAAPIRPKERGWRTQPSPSLQPPVPRTQLRRRVALLHLLLHRSLSSRQPSDRHTVGRAAYVVQSRLGANLDRGRIATVLTADSHLQLLTGLAAFLGGQPHQSSHTLR